MEAYGWVSRAPKYGMVYEWEIKNIDSAMDAKWAIDWFDALNELNIKLSATTIKTYGREVTHNMPVIAKTHPLYESLVDLPNESKKFFDQLAKRAKWKIMSDNLLGLRQAFLIDHYVVTYSPKGKDVATASTPISVFIPLIHNQVYQEEKRQIEKPDTQATIVMMKEELDGYVMREEYKLKINVPGQKREIDFPLKRDYDVVHPLTNKPMKLRDNYTGWLRYSIFSQPMQAKGLDPTERPLLQKRQYDIIKKKGKRTCFTCPRRAGKTIFLIEEAIKEIVKHNPKGKFRPTSVLFLWLSDKNLQPAINYLLKMKQSFGEIGDQIFHYDSKFNVFSFREGKNIKWSISFISCEWRNPGIGFFADAVFIDEAALVPRNIYDGIEPIITHEGASLMAASTMYKGVKKGWFYELLTEYEAHMLDYPDMDRAIIEHYDQSKPFEHFAGLRYTIDDSEFLTETEKNALKKKYSKDPERYLAELYSRFPDEGKALKYEWCVRTAEQLRINNYEYLCFGYDPALTKDKSALVIGGYNKHANKIAILEEHQLNKLDMGSYGPQVKQIKQLKTIVGPKYLNNPTNIFFAMDWTQKATAELLEMNDLTVDLRIAYHAGINISKSKTIYNELRVPKRELITAAQILIQNDKVIMTNDLKMLMEQLDSFYEVYNEETWHSIFEWEGTMNDDHVNAMLVMLYYFYDKMWLKYQIIKQKSTEETPNPNPNRKELRELRAEQAKAKKDETTKKANQQYWNDFIW